MTNQTNDSISSAIDKESSRKKTEDVLTSQFTSTPHVNGVSPSSSESVSRSIDYDTSKSTDNVSAVYGNYDNYQLAPDAPWPPPIFIRQDITPQERYYMEHRWYSQWSFFDTKASQNKNRYYRTQLIVGIGSVSVPVLVGINLSGVEAQILYVITVIISLSVAMATAVESLYTFGENWRSYRSAAEDMYQEKSLYDVKAGRYAIHKQPFIRFVERCEEIIAQQNGRWIQSQEQAAQLIEDSAAEVLDNQPTDRYGNPIATTTKTTSVSTFTAEPTASAHSAKVVETEQTYSETVYENSSVSSDTDTADATEVTDLQPATENIEGSDTQDPMESTSYG